MYSLVIPCGVIAPQPAEAPPEEYPDLIQLGCLDELTVGELPSAWRETHDNPNRLRADPIHPGLPVLMLGLANDSPTPYTGLQSPGSACPVVHYPGDDVIHSIDVPG